jgi:hypothetical protein
MVLGMRLSWVKPPVPLIRRVGGSFPLKERKIEWACPFRSFIADEWEASALTQPSRVPQLADSAPFSRRGPAEGSWPHRRCLRATFVLSHPSLERSEG